MACNFASSAGFCSVTSGRRSCSAIVTRRSSLEALQELSDVRELCPGEIEDRHQVARLDVLRIGDPAREIARRIRQGTRRYRLPVHQMAEIGAEPAARH